MKAKKVIVFALLVVLLVSTVACGGGDGEQATPMPTPIPPALAKLKLEVTAHTWREGQPYNIYDAIKDKLEEGGFEVVPRKSTAYDASLVVAYQEDKGREYSPTGVSPGLASGTNIQCRLKLYDEMESILLEKEIRASTPFWSSLDQLYSDALSDFEEEVCFKYLGEIIATKYGVGDEVSVLIAALEDDDCGTRESAARELGEIGDPRAIAPLTAALNNAVLSGKCYWLEVAAERALEKIRQ
ncbi:HEAT repeat domain-containing protein [Chloroflexota bacterium]